MKEDFSLKFEQIRIPSRISSVRYIEYFTWINNLSQDSVGRFMYTEFLASTYNLFPYPTPNYYSPYSYWNFSYFTFKFGEIIARKNFKTKLTLCKKPYFQNSSFNIVNNFLAQKLLLQTFPKNSIVQVPPPFTSSIAFLNLIIQLTNSSRAYIIIFPRGTSSSKLSFPSFPQNSIIRAPNSFTSAAVFVHSALFKPPFTSSSEGKVHRVQKKIARANVAAKTTIPRKEILEKRGETFCPDHR